MSKLQAQTASVSKQGNKTLSDKKTNLYYKNKLAQTNDEHSRLSMSTAVGTAMNTTSKNQSRISRASKRSTRRATKIRNQPQFGVTTDTETNMFERD